MIILYILFGCSEQNIVGYWSAKCSDLYFDFDGLDTVSIWERESGTLKKSGNGSYFVDDNMIYVTMEHGSVLTVKIKRKREDTMLVDVELLGEKTENVLWKQCK